MSPSSIHMLVTILDYVGASSQKKCWYYTHYMYVYMYYTQKYGANASSIFLCTPGMMYSSQHSTFQDILFASSENFDYREL